MLPFQTPFADRADPKVQSWGDSVEHCRLTDPGMAAEKDYLSGNRTTQFLDALATKRTDNKNRIPRRLINFSESILQFP